MRFYKTTWLIGFYVSLQLLEGKLVLKSWNNMQRHLVIALNMLIMAMYFVGLKWWQQKSGYMKISGDEDKKVSFVSSLFFCWMNEVLEKGSQRPLDQNDFLPLSDENSGRFVTDKLRKSWESEKHHEWETAQTLEKRVWYAFCQRCYHHFDGVYIVYNFSPSLSTVSRVSCF